MKSDDISLAAYLHAAAVKEKLATICNPLLNFDIKTFVYFRLFSDGRHFYLSNNLDLLRFCIWDIDMQADSWLGKEICHASKDNYRSFLWPNQRSDYILSAVYELDIWNGLSIFKRKEDGSVESWAFAANRSAEQAQNFYIENIELLKGFVAFFNASAAEIIVPPKSCYLIGEGFTDQSIGFDNYQAQKIQEFIEATPIRKRPLIVGEKEVFLSQREAQCLNFLAAGQTAKQIALNLNASPRTAEKYLENIKHKIGCVDKESLIKTYRESVLNWL